MGFYVVTLVISCSGLLWLKYWTLGSCPLYLLKNIMRLVAKELPCVEYFQRYVGPGLPWIILYSCGDLISGEKFLT